MQAILENKIKKKKKCYLLVFYYFNLRCGFSQASDQSLIPTALEMLKYLIRTSTTSMTSVPKPLKYLAPYYDNLKNTHKKMDNNQLKKGIADVISLLAMGTAGGEEARNNRECLKYCLQGTYCHNNCIFYFNSIVILR